MTTPHLDDEALSAALDGEATGPEEAHLSGCPECRAQLESLAAVARVVAAPVVPAPPAQVDAAIARALAAWAVDGLAPPETETGLAESASPAGPDPAGPAGPAGPPVPRGSGGSGGSGGSAGRADRRRATVAGPPPWLGVAAAIAAAVVVVGGVVGLLRLAGHKGTTTSSAASPSVSTSATPSVGAANPSPVNGAGGTGSTSAAAGRDLGEQTDPVALAQLIKGALSSQVAPATPGATPATRAPDSASASSVNPVAACDAPARAALGLGAGPQPPVSYSASLRWRGQPAVVIVFAPPGGQAGVVMAAGDCSLLARIPL